MHTKETYKAIIQYYNLDNLYRLKIEATLFVFLALCVFFEKDFFELGLKQILGDLNEE